MSIYAVNGKTPIAAWIPSRDDAGNGTTTLTDLVGSNNGTLTNMDPATDWVADTGAGGVRALDFDGSNDFVNCGTSSVLNLPTTISFACWVKPFRLSGTDQFLCERRTGSGVDIAYSVFLTGSNLAAFRFDGAGRLITSAASLTVNEWNLIAFITDSSNSFLVVNGVIETFTRIVGNTSPAGQLFLGRSTSTTTRHLFGRLDDARLWDVGLNATDIADLYAAGNGRGITFGGTIQTRRRRQLGGYGL